MIRRRIPGGTGTFEWLRTISKRLTTRHKKMKRNRWNELIWAAKMNNHTMNSEKENSIFLGANDIADLFSTKILQKRFEQGFETFQNNFSLYATKKPWLNYLYNIQSLRSFKYEDDEGYLYDDTSLSYLHFNIHSTHVSVKLIGEKEFVKKYTLQFEKDFEFVKNQIEWIYSSDGSSIEVPLQPDRMPVDEMYPFLGEQSLKEYYDDFMKSRASILLLIGPPGTGKTTFIRGYLEHTNSSAIVTYDASILEKDYVFANFIEGDKSVMIMEDADMFLKSRKESNGMMHKFLNVGDGLVTTRGKKMIFSTNLTSINDIDDALVRPGRCYDIIYFDEISQENAQKLANKCNIPLNGTRKSWTIADVFNQKIDNEAMRLKIKKTSTNIGFV